MFSVINCKLKIFREGVYYRRTNAVKSACYLISAAAELSACVENGINYRCSRYFLLWVYTCRNTTSVIGNSNNVPGMYLYFYLSAISYRSRCYFPKNNPLITWFFILSSYFFDSSFRHSLTSFQKCGTAHLTYIHSFRKVFIKAHH